jgi:flagellar export protein FliJ
MSFQFALDPVLRFRKTVEEREEAALKKIAYELTLVFEELELTERKILESEIGRAGQVFQRLNAFQLQAYYNEVNALKHRRKELEGQIAKLEEARAEQMNIYEAARRDRELLTDLQDQKRTVYEIEKNKREQKMLDDIYLARRSRF